MRCIDQEQAEERVKSIQALTLNNLGSLMTRADDLDGAAPRLSDEDAESVRMAAARIRRMIVLAREVESILDLVNHRRRDREAAQYAAPDIKIEMR